MRVCIFVCAIFLTHAHAHTHSLCRHLFAETLFNLTKLMHPTGYHVLGDIGGTTYEFELNVCQPLAHQPCAEGVHACNCDLFGCPVNRTNIHFPPPPVT